MNYLQPRFSKRQYVQSAIYTLGLVLNDWQEVKLIDMADIDGSQNVRVVLRGSAGVQHGIGADIVLYS